MARRNFRKDLITTTQEALRNFFQGLFSLYKVEIMVDEKNNIWYYTNVVFVNQQLQPHVIKSKAYLAA